MSLIILLEWTNVIMYFIIVFIECICMRLKYKNILKSNLLYSDRQTDINTDEQSWQCVADNTVSVGGCLIESDSEKHNQLELHHFVLLC